MTKRLPGIRMHNPIHFCALGFGLGFARIAPGTFGTLAAFPIYWLMKDWSTSVYMITLLIFFVFGIYCCGKTAADMGQQDHPAIVWDEVVGMLIALLALPSGWIWLLIAFVSFRFFDVIKPWPISWCDNKIHGGLGIMLDDVLAGFCALISVQLFSIGFS